MPIVPTYVPHPDPVFPTARPSATVILRGLLTLCFDGSTSCEVGVFNASPVFQPHNFVFRMWKKTSPGSGGDPVCPTEPTKVYATPLESFELRVVKPQAGFNDVRVFQRDPFDRTGSGNHDRDYRWIVDFEVDLYDRVVPKDPGKVKPRMQINAALFYTLHKTSTRFNAHPADGAGPVKMLGNVAEIVAANIYLDAGGRIEVRIDGQLVDTLDQLTGVEYQIDVLNLCDPSHSGCVFLPGHPSDRKRRNDFFQYFSALKLQMASLVERELVAVPPFQDSVADICRRPDEQTTDPAPCGPGGYGGSSTFGP